MSKYESIQYMNVYSKRYDDIAPSDVGKCIEEFYRLFRNAGLIADGNLIYALNKIDEEKLSIEFMLCAKESRHKGVKKLTYRSYLMISHMTSVVVKNDYETNMEGAYPIIEKKIQKGKETFVQWIMENYQLEQEKCISE